MGLKRNLPELTDEDVERARRAYQSIVDLPEYEQLARESYGDDWVDAYTTAAKPAAKILKVWK